jgi:hypothetical protein
MSVACECCVLWDRGICDGLITSPEESYRVWCDRDASTVRRPWPTRGCCAMKKNCKSWGFSLRSFLQLPEMKYF